MLSGLLLSAKSWIGEHVVEGRVVLPATGHLELMLEAAAEVSGAGCMLVWAGIVESFVSQYHQPVLPYALKIAFGCCELTALTFFLTWAGRE